MVEVDIVKFRTSVVNIIYIMDEQKKTMVVEGNNPKFVEPTTSLLVSIVFQFHDNAVIWFILVLFPKIYRHCYRAEKLELLLLFF